MGKGVPALLLIAAAFLVGLLPKAAQNAAAAGSATNTPATDLADGSEAGGCSRCLEPIRLYQEFFGLPLAPRPQEEPTLVGEAIDQAKGDGHFILLHERGGPAVRYEERFQTDLGAVAKAAKGLYRLEFLVATVPDPIDSSEAQTFDQALEALKSAISESGYLLDRLWLPWANEKDQENVHRQTPGVLLFRGARSNVLLTVLLVGETPKQGIHKAAFFRALRWIDALREKGSQRDVLRVLGPSFSGSADSFTIALRDPRAANLQVRIVSGTATSDDLPEAFSKVPTVTFCRTVPSDGALRNLANKFLADGLGWNDARKAFVSEDDTKYGRSATNPNDKPAPLVVRFPSGLAEVRTAQEKEEAGEAPSPAASEIQVSTHSLGLSLAEPRQPVDILPQESPLSSRSTERALANLFASFRQEGTRYVGILATDARDVLFLARRIRLAAPDVILFTLGGDLLLAHPQYTSELDGTLVVSSAPLFAEGTPWKAVVGSPPVRRFRRQFVSPFAKGVFLAAKRLVPPLKDAMAPGDINDTINTMRGWISVVGNGALWPLWTGRVYTEEKQAKGDGACFAQDLPKGAAQQPLPDGKPAKGEESPAGKGGNSGGSGSLEGEGPTEAGPNVALFAWLAILLAAGRWLGLVIAPLLGACDPPSSHKREWPNGLWLWACGFMTLWILAVAAMAAETIPMASAFGIRYLFLGGVLYSVLLWIVAQPATRLLSSWLIPGLAFGGALLVAPVAVVILLLWIPGWFNPWVMRTDLNFETQARLFRLRAWIPTNGLSPLVPLACLGAGFLIWVIVEAKRQALLSRQKIDWPIPKYQDASLESHQALAEEVDVALRLPYGDIGFWVRWILPLMCLAGLLAWQVQPIAEGRLCGFVFTFFASLLAALSAASFHQFLALWGALDALLDRLEHSRLLPAFRRVAADVDWNPMRSLGSRMPKARMLTLSVSLLWPSLQTALAPYLSKIFEPNESGSLAGEVAARKALNAHLVEVSNGVVGWSGEPNVQNFFAIRVIAYLRCAVTHLRSSLLGAFAPGLLLLAAVRTYAFSPQRATSIAIWAGLIAMVALTFWVFMQMDRDAVLSAIAGTPAGQVSFDRDFFWNVFAYGVVPIGSIAVAQFPQIGHFVVGWLNPILHSIGGAG